MDKFIEATPEAKQFALLVTLLSSLSTGIGGLIVYFFGEPTERKVSFAMAFSAGVMVYISFADMLPECVEVLGKGTADIAFFGGFVIFGMIHALIPDVDVAEVFIGSSAEQGSEAASAKELASSAGAAPPKTKAGAKGAAAKTTARGKGKAAAARPRKGTRDPSSGGKRSRSRSTSRPQRGRATEDPGETPDASTTGDGTGVDAVVVRHTAKRMTARSLLMTGIITTVGFSLHNAPEGVAVYLTCIRGVRAGLFFALAIAIHNIPEGVCVALPISVATGSRGLGLLASFISGLFEPLGALVFGIVFIDYLTPALIQIMLAGVAGMMIYISLVELFPHAYGSLSPLEVCTATTFGMGTISASLYGMRAIGL